jgi:hypothetical protein
MSNVTREARNGNGQACVIQIENNASKSDLNREPEPSKPSKPIQIKTNASKPEVPWNP